MFSRKKQTRWYGFWKKLRDYCDRKMEKWYMYGGNCNSRCSNCKQWEHQVGDCKTILEDEDDETTLRECANCGHRTRAIFTPAGFVSVDKNRKVALYGPDGAVNFKAPKFNAEEIITKVTGVPSTMQGGTGSFSAAKVRSGSVNGIIFYEEAGSFDKEKWEKLNKSIDTSEDNREGLYGDAEEAMQFEKWRQECLYGIGSESNERLTERMRGSKLITETKHGLKSIDRVKGYEVGVLVTDPLTSRDIQLTFEYDGSEWNFKKAEY